MQLLPQSLVATPARRLAVRLLFYGAVLLLALPVAFSQVMIGAIRRSAAPVAAGFSEVQLRSQGIGLRAWVAPGDPRRPAVVLVHGVGDSLESYRDQAEVLRARGHAVLLLDLRGHGGSKTARMTLGGHEREDVRAALAYLRQAGLAPAGFVLMGWSMGAVAVLRAAVVEPEVRAVVAEAPFDTYRDTVAHHAWLLYRIPRWLPLVPLSIAVAEWRADFDADEVDAVA
ncbi:MAG TPA: alpha/beta fold hydrolase, partial [Vicinamibacteria bacterium]|nr:alpha/beta fold hydrolase [Vicinamibacteria bacterium]